MDGMGNTYLTIRIPFFKRLWAYGFIGAEQGLRFLIQVSTFLATNTHSNIGPS